MYRPQSQQNLTRTLIRAIQEAGKDPSIYLTSRALSELHRTNATPETLDQREARLLLSELTDYFRRLQSGID